MIAAAKYYGTTYRDQVARTTKSFLQLKLVFQSRRLHEKARKPKFLSLTLDITPRSLDEILEVRVELDVPP